MSPTKHSKMTQNINSEYTIEYTKHITNTYQNKNNQMISSKQQISNTYKTTDKLRHYTMYITKVSMLSFSTENPLKTATLLNLDRFLLQSKFYLCQKSTYIRLYRKFVFIKNCSQYTFNKRNSCEIIVSFCSNNYTH